MKKDLQYNKLFAIELIEKTVKKIIINHEGKLTGIVFNDDKVMYADSHNFELVPLEKYKLDFFGAEEIIISKNEDGTFKYEEV